MADRPELDGLLYAALSIVTDLGQLQNLTSGQRLALFTASWSMKH